MFGLCPLRDMQPEDEGHGVWCAKRAFAELGVSFEGAPQVLLETGESLAIPVAEGEYVVEVRHADQGSSAASRVIRSRSRSC
ncbi:hypothetical protein OV203_08645 [Nannocystis sp. ILAH1]|uniref:hypothetical protein n=1 Tax=Nannocystis sp. ILAH1 TaxID=2996789 RepID=UPI002270A082|nr:hypothetical protein [Nannocystis sp. ILAH1]MCY0987190.1 hypothetical protein [Nannocystis sp. ILAH1]